jgi:D-proline reductase (dithiol) PrdB
MSDLDALESWQPKFQDWIRESQPLFREGKAKQAFAHYPWMRFDTTPFHRLDKPISQARVGLITTGGYSIDGEQAPFKPIPSFDDTPPGVRAIPLDVNREKLTINHTGYDHRFAEEDINVNLPLDRLSELAEAGEVGSVAPDTQVIMGLQPNISPLLNDLIPELVARFQSDSVEAALLVPS